MTSSSVAVRWGVPLAALVAMVVAPSLADADETPGRVQAEGLFAEGRELLEKGRFVEACTKLARSEELAPAVGTLLNLAFCYEQVGKLRSAMDAYVEAEALAVAAGEPKRAAFAKERVLAVEPRAPKLVVRVAPPDIPGLEIKRNGVVLAKTDLDRPAAVDPQDYVVTATAPGHVPWKGAVIVRGEGAVMTVIVPPLDDAAAARAEGVAPSSLGARRIMALGLGAASALAIGGGLAAALSAKSRYDDARPHCDATGCDDTGAAIQHGAVVQGNVATGLLAFGGLCGATAIYLWVVGAPASPSSPSSPPSPSSPSSPANAPRAGAAAMSVGVGPGGASLTGRF